MICYDCQLLPSLTLLFVANLTFLLQLRLCPYGELMSELIVHLVCYMLYFLAQSCQFSYFKDAYVVIGSIPLEINKQDYSTLHYILRLKNSIKGLTYVGLGYRPSIDWQANQTSFMSLSHQIQGSGRAPFHKKRFCQQVQLKSFTHCSVGYATALFLLF